MSCGRPYVDHGARRAAMEAMKQQHRQMWVAAMSGAVTGAVSGARGASGSAQVRIGDAERESAITALGEHFAAGRLSKDELDERMDAAATARTQSDLAVLFHDLPLLQAPAPPRHRPSQRARRSWWMGVRLSWVFVLLLVLAITGHVPWLLFAVFAFLWWSGMFSGLRHRSRRTG